MLRLAYCLVLSVGVPASSINVPRVESDASEWEWIAGNSTGACPNNFELPGARIGAHTWLVSSTSEDTDMLYLFGGWGLDPSGTPAFLNDLWSFNLVTLEWKFLTGSIDGNKGGTNHTPAARYYGVTWIEKRDASSSSTQMPAQERTAVRDTQLWLWSGQGSAMDGDDNGIYLRDTWSYNVADGTWTQHYFNRHKLNKSSPTRVSNESSRLPVGTSLAPIARKWSNFWSDNVDSMWVFSGVNDEEHGFGLFNDLWHFNSTTTAWTKLYEYKNITGIYDGPVALRRPGAREGAYTAFAEGKLCLFGGLGVGASTSDRDFGTFQDVWCFDLHTHTWTMLAGSRLPDQPPSYGAKGTPSRGNLPPPEHAGYQFGTAVGSTSKYLLFMGGEDGKSETEPGIKGDVWAFDLHSAEWIWLSGSSQWNATSHYGPQGRLLPGNSPGSRYAGQGWITRGTHAATASNAPESKLSDACVDVWVFGGYGYDGLGDRRYLSDVWVYRCVRL
eukprot:m.733636 g.733636  ORF g.733636 m.733636 type:complete len:500 (+) comp23073_c0_seq1:141-1640(+)